MVELDYDRVDVTRLKLHLRRMIDELATVQQYANGLLERVNELEEKINAD